MGHFQMEQQYRDIYSTIHISRSHVLHKEKKIWYTSAYLRQL